MRKYQRLAHQSRALALKYQKYTKIFRKLEHQRFLKMPNNQRYQYKWGMWHHYEERYRAFNYWMSKNHRLYIENWLKHQQNKKNPYYQRLSHFHHHVWKHFQHLQNICKQQRDHEWNGMNQYLKYQNKWHHWMYYWHLFRFHYWHEEHHRRHMFLDNFHRNHFQNLIRQKAHANNAHFKGMFEFFKQRAHFHTVLYHWNVRQQKKDLAVMTQYDRYVNKYHKALFAHWQASRMNYHIKFESMLIHMNNIRIQFANENIAVPHAKDYFVPFKHMFAHMNNYLKHRLARSKRLYNKAMARFRANPVKFNPWDISYMKHHIHHYLFHAYQHIWGHYRHLRHEKVNGIRDHQQAINNYQKNIDAHMKGYRHHINRRNHFNNLVKQNSFEERYLKHYRRKKRGRRFRRWKRKRRRRWKRKYRGKYEQYKKQAHHEAQRAQHYLNVANSLRNNQNIHKKVVAIFSKYSNIWKNYESSSYKTMIAQKRLNYQARIRHAEQLIAHWRPQVPRMRHQWNKYIKLTKKYHHLAQHNPNNKEYRRLLFKYHKLKKAYHYYTVNLEKHISLYTKMRHDCQKQLAKARVLQQVNVLSKFASKLLKALKQKDQGTAVSSGNAQQTTHLSPYSVSILSNLSNFDDSHDRARLQNCLQ